MFVGKICSACLIINKMTKSAPIIWTVDDGYCRNFDAVVWRDEQNTFEYRQNDLIQSYLSSTKYITN